MAQPDAPGAWRVHIGAHRTGTQHMQALLAHLEGELNAADLRILPAAVARRASEAAAQRGSGLSRVKGSIQLDITHSPRLLREARGADVAVFSEENILGWSTGLLEDGFYPDLSGLDLLARISRGIPLTLFLSVRSYDTLLQSAFFDIYRTHGDAPDRLRRGVRAVLAGRSGWPGLVDRIQTHLPEAEIRFWRQEVYGRDPAPVLAELLDRPLPALPDLPPPSHTRSPNANALAEVAELPDTLGVAQRQEFVDTIYARNPAGAGPRAQLITPSEAEALQAAYAGDLVRLRARAVEIGTDPTRSPWQDMMQPPAIAGKWRRT